MLVVKQLSSDISQFLPDSVRCPVLLFRLAQQRNYVKESGVSTKLVKIWLFMFSDKDLPSFRNITIIIIAKTTEGVTGGTLLKSYPMF